MHVCVFAGGAVPSVRVHVRGNAGEGARLHTEPGETTGPSHTVEPSTAKPTLRHRQRSHVTRHMMHVT